MTLVPITIEDVQAWFGDFEKKAKNFELTEGMSLIGIREGAQLVGYFVLQPYADLSIDIVQGYLQRSARHKRWPDVAMRLLEVRLSGAGFKMVRILAQRSLRAYPGFMACLGYKPTKIVFEKVI